MTPYNRARALATKWHEGQTRKNGEPYIDHCIRVADAVTQHLKVAAVLHDILEDTECTVSELIRKIGHKDAQTVVFLTHEKNESYLDYILMIRRSADATTIKLADLADNLNGATGTLKDKYELARWILEEGI